MNKEKINSFSRIISKITVLGLALSCVLTISGCEERKSDGVLRKEKIEQVIEYLDSREPSKIKSLFAPSAIAEIPNLDESITELFNYYKGTFVSIDWGGYVVNDSFERGDVTKDLHISFDITTTEDVFRIAIRDYRAEDTVNKKNLGIRQFLIIRYEDDPDSKKGYYYWGGLIDEPGLFIGTFHVREDPIEEVVELETYE